MVILPPGNNVGNSDLEKNAPNRIIEYKKANNDRVLYLVVRVTTAIFCTDVPLTPLSLFSGWMFQCPLS